MKLQQISLFVALAATSVTCFPAGFEEALVKRNADASACPHLKARNQNGKRAIGFDAAAQRIDVAGQHAFVPPSKTDQRGPCPGLNALANHNYISHNGVAPMTNIIAAVNQVFGMGIDLATFLAAYGTVMDGNPISLTPGYSIGGPAPASDPVAGAAQGFLGIPQGLSGSHNKYESDGSPTRGDLYLTGDDYTMRLDQFKQEYNVLQPNVDSIAQYQNLLAFRIARYKDSINRNPYFFYGPFTGVGVTPAAYSFQTAMMSNHSSEYVNGYFDQKNFASFFGVTGTPRNFNYKAGWERIPENWYRRPIGDEYSIALYLGDLVNHAVQYPQFLVPGGNTGKVNTFTPVNLTALTKGVYNGATLLQGNNLACFLFQLAPQATPDLLKQTSTSALNLLATLTGQINKDLAGLNCPQLQAIDKSQFSKYPGYQRSQPN